MKKIISMVAGGALLAASMLGAAAPAQAAHWRWDQGRVASAVEGWCASHPWSSDCKPHFRDKWGQDDYRRWYFRHHGEHGFDPGLAGLFGMAAVGTAAAMAAHSH
jgi:hypothetical protein